MPCGSRACFTRAVQGAHFRWRRPAATSACLARPMPCSPVIEPPQAMTCAKSSSSAACCAPVRAGLVVVHHDVGVDVAVAGVAETGDRQAVLLLQPRGEGKQIFQPAAGHDDVLVQLGQAGVAQGVGEFAADFPDGFALGRAQAALDKERLLRRDDSAPAALISPRTERSWPSSSTIRWARQPRRRSLLVRL